MESCIVLSLACASVPEVRGHCIFVFMARKAMAIHHVSLFLPSQFSTSEILHSVINRPLACSLLVISHNLFSLVNGFAQ